MSKNPPCGNAETPKLFRRPEELLDFLGLTDLPLNELSLAPDFKMRVPLSYAARMAKNDPQDPLLRQVLPLRLEENNAPGFSHDPVNDAAARKRPGLLHKYQGRALLLLSAACPLHCRYCFRRHYPYSEVPADWMEQALDYIRRDSRLKEVILSGGDPLSLSNAKLGLWYENLSAVPHLSRLRIHSRVPVALPERINADLLDLFQSSRLSTVMVIHANHPAEIDFTVREALQLLRAGGVWLFNQSVLLRGVNDKMETLRALSESLAECGVTPYYLHLLDKVQGAAHFAVPKSEAKQLMRELRAALPGYLVPRLVEEIAGMPYKREVALG